MIGGEMLKQAKAVSPCIDNTWVSTKTSSAEDVDIPKSRRHFYPEESAEARVSLKDNVASPWKSQRMIETINKTNRRSPNPVTLKLFLKKNLIEANESECLFCHCMCNSEI